MEDEVLQAKKKAMNLLLHNDRTERELRDRLKRAGFSEAAEEEAISYVMSFHYIDDARYARRYVEIYQNRKSKKQLVMDMKKRGVGDREIQQALEEEWQGDSEALQAALKKKTQDVSKLKYEEKQKIAASLSRKGFSVADVQKALEM